jgi:uncharacterized membrane protein
VSTTERLEGEDRRDTRFAEPYLRYLLAVAMVTVGVLHFATPAFFVGIMPRMLPAGTHLPLVLVSGVFEVLGGIGLLPARSRRFSAFGLMALYVCVFPANLRMAMEPETFHVPPAAAYARLPLQLVLLAWAYRYTKTSHLSKKDVTS